MARIGRPQHNPISTSSISVPINVLAKHDNSDLGNGTSYSVSDTMTELASASSKDRVLGLPGAGVFYFEFSKATQDITLGGFCMNVWHDRVFVLISLSCLLCEGCTLTRGLLHPATAYPNAPDDGGVNFGNRGQDSATSIVHCARRSPRTERPDRAWGENPSRYVLAYCMSFCTPHTTAIHQCFWLRGNVLAMCRLDRRR